METKEKNSIKESLRRFWPDDSLRRTSFASKKTTLCWTRRVLLSIGVCYLPWYFVCTHFIFQASEDFLGRLAVTMISFLLYAVTFNSRSKNVESSKYAAYMVLWGITAHTYYLAAQNNYSTPYLFLCFVTLVCVCLVFRHVKELLCYAVFAAFLAAFHAFNQTTEFHSVYYFIGTVFTLFTLCMVMGVRLGFIDRLEASEKRLEHSLSSWGAILRNSPDTVFIMDVDGVIQFINNPGIGYKHEDVIGENAFDFVDSAYRARFDRALLHAKETDTFSNFEVQVKGPDGDSHWSWNRVWHLSERQKTLGYMVWVVDITEQKMAHISTVNNSKFSALGEMAGGVAHEINNPLAIIDGFARNLSNRAKRGDYTAELVSRSADKISDTVYRISKIVRGLRDFARDGSQDKKYPADIYSIILSAVELCREKFKNRGVELEFEKSETTWNVKCRKVQISQVILNVLINALDAAEENEQGWVRISVSCESYIINIVVEDSGEGIESEKAEQIFQPFYTGKPLGKGMGLGLSLSKGIVEDHGGKIYLDSSKTNTRFVIQLPLFLEEEEFEDLSKAA